MPTNEDLQRAVDQLKKTFLAVYKDRIDEHISDRGYGPLTAEKYRSACSEGYICALSYPCPTDQAVNFALGYAQGFVEADLRAIARFAWCRELARMKTRELFDIDEDMLSEAEDWHQHRGGSKDFR